MDTTKTAQSAHPLQPDSREFRLRISGLLVRVVQEAFAASLLTYLVFYMIDSFIDSFVSKQFNMNILLWIVMVSGVLLVLLGPRPEGAPKERVRTLTIWTIVIIAALGVITAGIVYIKARSLGNVSYAVSVLSGILVMVLSFVLLFEDEEKHHAP